MMKFTSFPYATLVVIHKYLRDTVILAGMPESSHMDVNLLIGKHASIKRLHRCQVTIHGTDTSITHRDVGNADIAGANICPCRYDGAS